MRALLAALAVAAPLAAAAPAQAWSIAGEPWPGPRITYYAEAGSQNDEVIRATNVLNRVLDGVRFRRVSSRFQADVYVTYFARGRGCGGQATVGYNSFTQSRIWLGRGCPDGITRLTAIHEFAHVLGLGHEEDVCALMNPVSELPTGTPTECRRRPLRYWLANPLQRDDLRGLRALYPGSGKRAVQPPADGPRILR